MNVSVSFSAMPAGQVVKKVKTSRFRGMDIKLGERAIRQLKPCDRLLVVAHPDDEVCFFGFIAKYFKNPNERIQLVYTTSGQNGRDITKRTNRYTPIVRDKRLAELGNVMTVLKAKNEPLVLDMMDSETHHPQNRAVLLDYLKAILRRTQPKAVYSFDESGITGHTDHFTASVLTRKAIRELDSSKTTHYWNVGLTQRASDKLVMDTAKTTKMFSYARPSINEPDKIIDISEEVPVLIRAFQQYKTQFLPSACQDIRKYFRSYPFITLRRTDY